MGQVAFHHCLWPACCCWLRPPPLLFVSCVPPSRLLPSHSSHFGLDYYFDSVLSASLVLVSCHILSVRVKVAAAPSDGPLSSCLVLLRGADCASFRLSSSVAFPSMLSTPPEGNPNNPRDPPRQRLSSPTGTQQLRRSPSNDCTAAAVAFSSIYDANSVSKALHYGS